MFDLKYFLKRLSPEKLQEYCDKKSLSYSVSQEAQESLEIRARSFHDFLMKDLPTEQRAAVLIDFQDVDEMIGGAGTFMLRQRAREEGHKVDEAFFELSSADKIMWFFLLDEELFKNALLDYEIEQANGWMFFKTEGVDSTDLITPETEKALGDEVGAFYLDEELRGDLCKAEGFEKDGLICFVAYPRDYIQMEPQYDDLGELDKTSYHWPVFRAFFIFDAQTGRLRTKVKGGVKKKQSMASVFGRTVLGTEITKSDRIYFNLDRLKDFNFEFYSNPDQQVQKVQVVCLKLDYPSGFGRRLTLDLSSKGGHENLKGMRDWVRDLNLVNRMDEMSINFAKIKITFEPEARSRPREKGTVTVQLTPTSCNLGLKPLARRASQLLIDWGIDVDTSVIEQDGQTFTGGIKERSSSEVQRQRTGSPIGE